MFEKPKNKPKRQKSQTVQTIKWLFVLIVGGFLVLSAVAYDRTVRGYNTYPSANATETALIEKSVPCDTLQSRTISGNGQDTIAFEAALQSAHEVVLGVSYPEVTEYCYVPTNHGGKDLGVMTIGFDLHIASRDPGSDAERAQIIMDVLPTVKAEKPIDFMHVQFNFYEADTLVTQWTMPYWQAIDAVTQSTSAQDLYAMGH